MPHENQATRLRSQRSNTKSKPAKLNPQLRLQERQALQELPRDQRRKRSSHQEERSILSPDIGRQRPVRYFSTFSGIGGFELGIERALDDRGIASSSTLETRRSESHTDASNGYGRRTNATCVGYSEIDKYASQIYQSHFPTHINIGDITKIDADALPDFDLYVGGFPCQAFSIAGKRGGFEDTRGTLFFDVARLLKAKRPKHFLLENVKGLLSHDNGRTFKTIIATLIDLGYGVEWQVLNSKDFGVPQNRERVFIVGHLGGKPTRAVFPLASHDGKDTALHPGEATVANTVVATYARNQSDAQYVAEGARIRRLMPVECERLQGFPDGWTEGISDTQRYKTLGNAVTVNVIEAVISALYN